MRSIASVSAGYGPPDSPDRIAGERSPPSPSPLRTPSPEQRNDARMGLGNPSVLHVPRPQRLRWYRFEDGLEWPEEQLDGTTTHAERFLATGPGWEPDPIRK